jgi:hypothetical protein
MINGSRSPEPSARPGWSGPVALSGFAVSLAFIGGGWMLEQSLLRRGLETQEGDFGILTAFVLFAVLAAVLVWLVPRNPVAWIFFGIVMFGGVAYGGLNYASYHAQVDPLPAGALMAWISNWSWYLTLALVGIFLPLYFPTGRLLSPRWRWVARLSVFAVVLTSSRFALAPGELDALPLENPFGVDAIEPYLPAMDLLSGVLLLAAAILSLASSVIRFRRSRGQERQQMKWFVLGMSLFISLILISELPLMRKVFDGVTGEIVFSIGFGLIPVSAGLAILKHRLYAIDTVINRILVYGVLTALLIGAYLVTVVGLQVLLQPVTSGSDLVVAASTLAVAAIFRPLRNRVQHFIDRRFYRHKYDAVELLARFAEHLRQEVDLDAAQQNVLAVVRETMQPQRVSLWVKASGPTVDVADGAS